MSLHAEQSVPKVPKNSNSLSTAVMQYLTTCGSSSSSVCPLSPNPPFPYLGWWVWSAHPTSHKKGVSAVWCRGAQGAGPRWGGAVPVRVWVPAVTRGAGGRWRGGRRSPAVEWWMATARPAWGSSARWGWTGLLGSWFSGGTSSYRVLWFSSGQQGCSQPWAGAELWSAVRVCGRACSCPRSPAAPAAPKLEGS